MRAALYVFRRPYPGSSAQRFNNYIALNIIIEFAAFKLSVSNVYLSAGAWQSGPRGGENSPHSGAPVIPNTSANVCSSDSKGQGV